MVVYMELRVEQTSVLVVEAGVIEVRVQLAEARIPDRLLPPPFPVTNAVAAVPAGRFQETHLRVEILSSLAVLQLAVMTAVVPSQVRVVREVASQPAGRFSAGAVSRQRHMFTHTQPRVSPPCAVPIVP